MISRNRRRRTSAVAVAVAATLAGPGLATTIPASAATTTAAKTTNLVVPNGSFEAPLSTWRPVGRSGMWRAAPHQGKFSLGVFARTGGSAYVDTAEPIAAKIAKGSTYTATMYVSTPASTAARVELRETRGNKVVGWTPVTVVPKTAGWTKVTVTRRAATDGGALSLRLGTPKAAAKRSVRFDTVRATVTTVPVAVKPPAPVPAPATLFGATPQRRGDDFVSALKRSTELFGTMDVHRVFYPGLPAGWPGNAGLSGGPVVVSFKAQPSDIVAGKHDAFFTDWFAKAPRDRQIWWSFWHEPEDDIERKRFTAAQYRAAWAHLAKLEETAKNSRLDATLILMCWSLEAPSGRNWKDYYAGGSVVDTLGWDCYNSPVRDGRYGDPAARFGDAIAASKSVGKPWGIAEFGSRLAAGDTGAGRAQWIKDTAVHLKKNGAAFATYFDSNVGGEFRLLDKPSQDAWRWVLANL